MVDADYRKCVENMCHSSTVCCASISIVFICLKSSNFFVKGASFTEVDYGLTICFVSSTFSFILSRCLIAWFVTILALFPLTIMFVVVSDLAQLLFFLLVGWRYPASTLQQNQKVGLLPSRQLQFYVL